jgi:hypothetical protein
MKSKVVHVIKTFMNFEQPFADLIASDACELIANRAKCVNDKDPELMQEIIRHEDKNYPV